MGGVEQFSAFWSQDLFALLKIKVPNELLFMWIILTNISVLEIKMEKFKIILLKMIVPLYV